MDSGRYAKGTHVPADRSKIEIERILTRYGVDQFMYGWEDSRAMIGLRYSGKLVRFILPLPDPSSDEFTLTPGGGRRDENGAEKAYQQAVRQRWRALALIVKAKLEATETGITSFEQEFLAHIVLPDNRTVGEYLLTQIEDAYACGKMPRMLPGVAQG